MKFTAEVVAALPASTIDQVLQDHKLTATGSHENPSNQVVSSTWLALHSGLERASLIQGDDIAGFVSVAKNTDTICTTTCITNLRDVRAVRYVGANQGDSLEAPAPCFVAKTQLANSVLVPMPEEAALTLGLAYDEHNLEAPYAPSGNTFTWPASTTVEQLFPDLRTNEKLVLAALPNALAVAFGSNPPDGKELDPTMAEVLNQLEQDLDLAPLYHAMATLKQNGYKSWHYTVTGTESRGALISDVSTDLLAAIGGQNYLLTDYGTEYYHPPSMGTNAAVIRAAFLKAQRSGVAVFLNGNEAAQQTYNVHKHGREAASPGTATDTTTKKTKTKQSRERAYMGTCLLIMTSQTDDMSSFSIGVCRPTTAAGFLEDDHPSASWNGYRKYAAGILNDHDTSNFKDIQFNPATAASMKAIHDGRYAVNDPLKETATEIGLGHFTPLTRKDARAAEAHEESAQLEEDLNQAEQHRSKKSTTLHSNYNVRSIWEIINALKSYSATMLCTSDTPIEANTAIPLKTQPCICRALYPLIVFMSCADFNEWYRYHSKRYPHLCVAIMHTLGGLISDYHAACFDYQTVTEGMGGTVPGPGSKYHKALFEIFSFVEVLEKCVKTQSIGSFHTTTRLYEQLNPVKKDNNNRNANSNNGNGNGNGRNNTQPQQSGANTGNNNNNRNNNGNTNTRHTTGNNNTSRPDNNTPDNFPKLFQSSDGQNINLAQLGSPLIDIAGKKGYMCGAAHTKGRNCTRPNCRFMHLPTDWKTSMNAGEILKLTNWVQRTARVSWTANNTGPNAPSTSGPNPNPNPNAGNSATTVPPSPQAA